MLQVIKYYMTYRYGLMLQVAMSLIIVLHTLVFESEITEVIPFITGALLVSYWSIFTGFVREQKFDVIYNDLPISKTMMNVAKYISYYTYLAFYFSIFALYAMIFGIEILPVMSRLMSAFAFTFIFASASGKVISIGSKLSFINLSNIVYLILGILGIYYRFSSPTPDHINLNGYIPHLDYLIRNLAVLLLFTSLDFFTMYLNRNKLVIG